MEELTFNYLFCLPCGSVIFTLKVWIEVITNFSGCLEPCFFFVCEVLSPLSQALNDLSNDWTYLQLRVYLRTYALEQMVQAASSSAGLRTIKRVEQALQELGVCSCFLNCECHAYTHFYCHVIYHSVMLFL